MYADQPNSTDGTDFHQQDADQRIGKKLKETEKYKWAKRKDRDNHRIGLHLEGSKNLTHHTITKAIMEPDKIATEIRKLSLPQKLILALDMWDSIALERGNLPMPEWQKSELQKRYMQYQQGELELHDWQDVHEELRRTY